MSRAWLFLGCSSWFSLLIAANFLLFLRVAIFRSGKIRLSGPLLSGQFSPEHRIFFEAVVEKANAKGDEERTEADDESEIISVVGPFSNVVGCESQGVIFAEATGQTGHLSETDTVRTRLFNRYVSFQTSKKTLVFYEGFTLASFSIPEVSFIVHTNQLKLTSPSGLSWCLILLESQSDDQLVVECASGLLLEVSLRLEVRLPAKMSSGTLPGELPRRLSLRDSIGSA